MYHLIISNKELPMATKVDSLIGATAHEGIERHPCGGTT